MMNGSVLKTWTPRGAALERLQAMVHRSGSDEREEERLIALGRRAEAVRHQGGLP